MSDETSEQAGDDDRPASVGRLPFAVFVLFEAALAPLALLIGWAVGQHPLADFKWDINDAVTGLAVTAPMLATLAIALRWPVGPLVKIRLYFDRELAPALRGCDWPDLALISVAAGVGEEMLFRGVMQGVLARLLGPFAAVVAAGTVFGLLHPVSVAYVAWAGFVGAYLGLIWVKTGNLLVVIVAHAAYDFVALLALLHDPREATGVTGD